MQNRIYFENLAASAGEPSVRELFSRAGKVESIDQVTDGRTGKSSGYGFVSMSTESEARSAVHQLNGILLDGNRLTVTLAGPIKRKIAGFRGGLNSGERKNR